jgi:o-succinylbenzoate synthase
MSLVQPVATAAGRHHLRPILLVLVETDEGAGRGECEALATSSYSGESIDIAEEALATEIIPRLLLPGSEFATTEDAIASLSPSATPMAAAALEMALLDAHLRAEGKSLASYLEASRVAIPAGATIGIRPIRDVLGGAREARASGIRRVKLKIAPDADVVPARAIRDEYPDVGLVVDANGSYSIADPSHRSALRALDELGLAGIEQPLTPNDLAGHARLVAELRTPILLDESFSSLGDLERVIDAGACSAVCVKPARLGGVMAARRARDRCVSAGISMAIGGLFEAGLGRAASIAVGALDGFDLGGDLGPSARYFERDITAPHTLVQGMLPVPMRPGVGVDLRDDVVHAMTASSKRFSGS